MSAGLFVTDASNLVQELSTENENGGAKRQRVKASYGADGEIRDITDADPMPVRAFARLPIVSASFVRPANANAYSALDAVSNNATAGSVTPLVWQVSDVNDAPVTITRIVCRTNDTGAGAGNVHTFRLFLYNQLPQATAGDNSPWVLTSVNGYLGSLVSSAFELMSDGSIGFFVPLNGVQIQTKPESGGKNIYGLLRSEDGFTPNGNPSGNSTMWTFTTEGEQGR